MAGPRCCVSTLESVTLSETIKATELLQNERKRKNQSTHNIETNGRPNRSKQIDETRALYQKLLTPHLRSADKIIAPRL